MRMSVKFGLTAVLVLWVLLVGERSAQAYIDPGTGSIILQAILAAILGVGVTAKIFWQKIKLTFLSMFGARRQENKEKAE